MNNKKLFLKSSKNYFSKTAPLNEERKFGKPIVESGLLSIYFLIITITTAATNTIGTLINIEINKLGDVRDIRDLTSIWNIRHLLFEDNNFLHKI